MLRLIIIRCQSSFFVESGLSVTAGYNHRAYDACSFCTVWFVVYRFNVDDDCSSMGDAVCLFLFLFDRYDKYDGCFDCLYCLDL